MTKQELREWVKKERKNINMEQISSVLIEKLVKTDEYKNAENIMIFYPLEDEVNFLPLLNDTSKNFYLPRIKGKDMECCRYRIGDALCESCFHTQEPVCSACNMTELDMVIVPALACDENNFRLGYGGGYYDRFLKDYKGIKISCVSKEFLVNTVYPEKHDIKMDLVMTD